MHLKKLKVANTKSNIMLLTFNHNEGNNKLTVTEYKRNNNNKKKGKIELGSSFVLFSFVLFCFSFIISPQFLPSPPLYWDTIDNNTVSALGIKHDDLMYTYIVKWSLQCFINIHHLTWVQFFFLQWKLLRSSLLLIIFLKYVLFHQVF